MGMRANTQQITETALRLLYLRIRNTDSSWKILVNVGKDASSPIWKLLAPSIMANATIKVPPARVTIASVVIPSFRTVLSPSFTSCSVRVSFGVKITMLQFR